MTRRPWTDDEIGFVQDSAHLTADEIAEHLDRTSRAVADARRFIREGWSGPKRKFRWAEADDAALIEAGPFVTAEALVELFPDRTPESIKKRRTMLGLVLHTQIGQRPGDIGARPLIAKTCFECGLLLAGSWFTFYKKKNGWASYCRACCSAKAGTSKRDGRADNPVRVAAQRKAEYQKLQRLTADRADRRGEPYTSSDLEVLADQSLTDFQKALRLQRSYGAVQGARQRAGLKSKPDGLGDPERDVWVIDNPNAARLLEASA